MNLLDVEDKGISSSVGEPPRPGVLVLRAVGDIALIGGVAAGLEQHGCQYPFEHVAQFIRHADLAFGNLEMPICSDTQRKPYFPDVCPDFRCPRKAAEGLKATGFDVLNLANNHTMDWGVAGLRETLSSLREVGLHTIGAGETLHEARQPAIFVRNGLRIAFLGYGVPGAWTATATQPGTAPIDDALILEDMRAIRDQVDLLVVSIHAGTLSDYPEPEDRRLKKKLIGNGADSILGHGPHVLQAIEVYERRMIAHSLGNFIIDLSSGNIQSNSAVQEKRESIILEMSLTRAGTSEVTCIPVLISQAFQTVPAGPRDAARILARLETLSNNLERMHGLTLWQHAGGRTVEHELRVIAFQARAAGWRHVFKRVKKIRWRHFRLFLGYLLVQAKKMIGRERVGEQPLSEGERHD